jgi:hypothetical protein
MRNTPNKKQKSHFVCFNMYIAIKFRIFEKKYRYLLLHIIKRKDGILFACVIIIPTVQASNINIATTS